MLVLVGPQFFRNDLRQDLAAADVLKVLPLPGWQIVLGELLAPAAILTGIQWLLLALIFAFAGPAQAKLLPAAAVSFGPQLAIIASIAVVLPALNAVSLFIPNAAALLFPAWFAAGKEGPGGFEVMGQRLIFAFGQFFAMLLALLPAGLAFAGVFFIAQLAVSPWLAAPLAAGVAALVLAAEAGLGVWWLGTRFEKFDLTHD